VRRTRGARGSAICAIFAASAGLEVLAGVGMFGFIARLEKE